MPSHNYQDREGIQLVPDGDYILGVEYAALRMAKNDIEVRSRILTKEGTGPLVYSYLGFDEKRAWAIDVFLKALQRAPAKGTVLDISDEWLQEKVKGALGWAQIGRDTYQGKDKNVIVRWLTSGKPDPYKVYADTKANKDWEDK